MEKLIRDRIPQLAAERGQSMKVRQASAAEMHDLLLAKLDEETAEVRAANHHGLPVELADVLEVVRALAALNGHSKEALERIAEQKAATHGRFSNRLVWECAPHNRNNPPNAEN